MYLDELITPLRAHLAPRLSDNLLIGLIGGASKRLEGAIKRVSFTSKRSSFQHFKTNVILTT